MYTVVKANFLHYEEYIFPFILIQKYDCNTKQVLVYFESTEILFDILKNISMG